MSDNEGTDHAFATEADSDAIRDAINAHPQVESLIHMKMLYLAQDELLVGATIAFAPHDLPSVADAIGEVKAAIQAAVPAARVIYLEPDVYRGPSEAHPPTDIFVIRGVD